MIRFLLPRFRNRPTLMKRKGNFDPKPLKGAAQRDTRPILQNVLLDYDDETDNPILVATDSFGMVKVPLLTEHEPDPDKPADDRPAPRVIPMEAMKYIQAHPGQPFEVTDRGVKVGDVEFTEEINVDTFPNWRGVIKGQINKPRKPLRVGFNAALLKNIADALGCEQIEVTIDLDKLVAIGKNEEGYREALVVKAAESPKADGPDGIGWQMPIRIGDDG